MTGHQPRWLHIILAGLKSGLLTVWTLGKVIFPVTLIMTILKGTAFFDYIVKAIAPVMHIFGMPGEAAVPLVLANFLNLYAGIGAVMTLPLSVKSVLILAVMMSFSHNLLVECGVASRVGISLWIMIAVRIGLAFISGIVINLLWHGGGRQASYSLISEGGGGAADFPHLVLKGLETAALGIIELAIIILPLMLVIEMMKTLNWLQVFSKWMGPFTRMLGMKQNASTTLAAGLLFGLAYGAGVMVQAVREEEVDKKSLYLAFIFLVGCHAVVEDTLIFIPLGIPVWPLLGMRLVIAVILTWIIAAVWKFTEKKRSRSRFDNNTAI